MKLNKNIKSAAILLHFASFMMVFFMSCNYVLENKMAYNDIETEAKDPLNTKKQEASLLVMASQNSLDVIELCQFIEKTNLELEKDVENLTADLEKTHKEIFKEYKEIANEKLISIPIYSNIEIEIQNENIEQETFIETNLSLISQKINNQIELLDKLSKTTNNAEFKELSEKANAVLRPKLDKTKNTLKKLEI